MFMIMKEFRFEAAHSLSHLPEGHKCKRVHGHSYRVQVVIESPQLDDRGFCQLDYSDLDEFKKYLDETFDHRNLNEVLPFRTTAENIAKYLYERARETSMFVSAVRVSETNNTWAEYRM